MDPNIEWDEKEEKRLVRRVSTGSILTEYANVLFPARLQDLCMVCVMFFALQLDRGNISQALSDNMLDDLRLTTNDYNYGMLIFYLCFLCAELPSQLICKKLGPDNWIPVQMCCWSIVACSQSRITGKSTFFATRALLGLFEAGFIPDVILYLC